MKCWIGLTATTWIVGQVAGPMDAPSWLGTVSQLSATGLLFWLFFWVLTKQLPTERAESKRHLEEVVKNVVDDQREDRRAFVTELARLSAAVGKCEIRNEHFDRGA